jgi:ketosteroid isomerase-like protein
MENKEMEQIVEQYFAAYSEFDVDKMVSYLHEDVKFRNISQGHVTLELDGKKSFTNQARQAVNLFEKREIKIDGIEYNDDGMDVKINFTGVLAIDVPEGPKKGEKVELKGRSLVNFSEGKIISIDDIN